jgi:iron(III) transport system substrate-binding protein
VARADRDRRAGAAGSGFAARALRALAVFVAAAALLPGCGGGARRPVVVYSPHGRAMLDAFKERFEAAYPQYELQYLEQGSQEVLERVIRERAAPQADVWWGAGAPTFATAAGEGVLEPFTPSWAGAIPAESKDALSRWVGIYETPEVIVYNTAVVSEADAPKDWDELLDERWRGKIIIREPVASDTMRTVFGAIILREWDKTGGPEGGYAWLRRLAANTRDYSPGWDAMLTSLNRQEAPVTVWNMPDVKRIADERGYTLATRFAESGTPVLVDGVAVVKGGPNPEGARALCEFVGTPESLAAAARDFYRMPVRKDLDPASLPEWLRGLEFRRMPVDWARFQAGIREWMAHWMSEIKGSAPAP